EEVVELDNVEERVPQEEEMETEKGEECIQQEGEAGLKKGEASDQQEEVDELEKAEDIGTNALLYNYNFPWSLTKYIPFYEGAEYHDYHHYVGGQNQSNFASVFTYCNYIYGTDVRQGNCYQKEHLGKVATSDVGVTWYRMWATTI
ncbi:hypothetical protein IFM89_015690, partial [Coptis chinensis]